MVGDMKKELISVVIPAYNEEGNLPQLIGEIIDTLESFQYEIIVVNDGSSDNTEKIVEEMHHQDHRINLISLSRNFGHQAALLAGLEKATGDCVISIDADLEQPPKLMLEMIQKWHEGSDIVYSIHQEAKYEGWFKKMTSRWFYKVFNFLTGMKLAQSCDFRLMDKKVVKALRHIGERSLFLRGMVVWMGFQSDYVYYTRGKRTFGMTHYPFKKMLNLALNGIISFSIRPLHFIVLFGILIGFIGCMLMVWIAYLKFFTDKTIAGWSSLTGIVLMLGGAQLFVMGIIGEYIGILVSETKRRPRYLIRKSTLKKRRSYVSAD